MKDRIAQGLNGASWIRLVIGKRQLNFVGQRREGRRDRDGQSAGETRNSGEVIGDRIGARRLNDQSEADKSRQGEKSLHIVLPSCCIGARGRFSSPFLRGEHEQDTYHASQDNYCFNSLRILKSSQAFGPLLGYVRTS